MKGYTLRMCILTVGLMLINFGVDEWFFDGQTLQFGYWVILIFSVVTQVVHKILLNLLKTQTAKFPLWYQLSALIKIILYFAVAIIYLFAGYQERATAFLSLLTICYLAFHVVETVTMSKIVRTYQQPKDN
ncbi:MAG: hypothetical protein ACK5JS_00875 [Mangrovibacterium sp.]